MIALARIGVVLLLGASTAWGWQQKLPAVYANGGGAEVLVPSGDVAVARCTGTGEAFADRLQVTMLRGSTGAQRWQRSVPNTNFCIARYLIADDTGDVVLATTLTGLNPARPAVLKLAGSDGRVLWRYEGDPGFASGLMRRSDGSIVVSADGTTTALDGETGMVLWSVTSEGSLGELTSNAAGDVFALLTRPYSENPSGDPGDVVVVELDGASGVEGWRHVFDGTAVGGGGGDVSWDVGAGLAVDGAGDVVVVGWLTNAHPHPSSASWDQDALVAKIAGASGEERWRTVLEGAAGGDDRATRIAIAAGGDPVVGLHLDGMPQLARFSGSSGSAEWQVIWGTGNDEIDEYVAFIAIDAADGVVTIGKYADRIAIAGFSGATGDPQWLQTFVAQRRSHDRFGNDLALAADGVALGARGEIAVTGTATRSMGGKNLGRTTATLISSTVAGKRLVIQDDGAVRKVTLRLRDSHITPALPDAPGDPSVSGASLELSSAAGGRVVLALPAAGWAKRSKGGFRYRGTGDSEPCAAVVLAPGSLAARCRTDDAALSLDAALGSVAVAFRVGEPGFPYCASFGGTVKSDRPVSADEPGLFRAIHASAPASCE